MPTPSASGIQGATDSYAGGGSSCWYVERFEFVIFILVRDAGRGMQKKTTNVEGSIMVL